MEATPDQSHLITPKLAAYLNEQCRKWRDQVRERYPDHADEIEVTSNGQDRTARLNGGEVGRFIVLLDLENGVFKIDTRVGAPVVLP